MVVVLRIKDLSSSASREDVKELFRGLKLKSDDIVIAAKPKGPFLDAFVRFYDGEEARRASTRTGKTIRGRRVNVILSSPEELTEIIERSKTGPPPRGDRSRGDKAGGRPGGRAGARVGARPGIRGVGDVRSRLGRGSRNERPAFSSGRNARPGSSTEGLQSFGSARERGTARDARSGFSSPRGRGRSTKETRTGAPPAARRHSSESRPNRRGQEFVGETLAALQPKASEPHEISERRFVKISGIPFSSSELEIQDFFRGILTRKVYLLKHSSGKFAGRPNGEALIEFFNDRDAREALERDGSVFGSRPATVMRPRKEEIVAAVAEVMASDGNLSSANAASQLQSLLHLLGSFAAASLASMESTAPGSTPTRDTRDDPALRRIARSAGINMDDIKNGRVVGIRNLPFRVTPEEILNLFRGYGAIPESIRIHHMEDGRCSGDAMICFRQARDAQRACSNLNKSPLGRRKVEMFVL